MQQIIESNQFNLNFDQTEVISFSPTICKPSIWQKLSKTNKKKKGLNYLEVQQFIGINFIRKFKYNNEQLQVLPSKIKSKQKKNKNKMNIMMKQSQSFNRFQSDFEILDFQNHNKNQRYDNICIFPQPDHTNTITNFPQIFTQPLLTNNYVLNKNEYSKIFQLSSSQQQSRFENDYEIQNVIQNNKILSKQKCCTIYQCKSKFDGLVYIIKRLKNINEELFFKQIQLSMDDDHFSLYRFYCTWNQNDQRYAVYQNCLYNLQELKNQKKKIPESTIRLLLLQISNDLLFLKQKQYNHLNITPENIIYTANRKFKLSDFLLTTQNIKYSKNNKYMAPQLKKILQEQSFNTLNYSKLIKSDIYSLGMVLLQNMTQHLYQKQVLIRKLQNSYMYSPSLKNLIKQMVNESIQQRPNIPLIKPTKNKKKNDLQQKLNRLSQMQKRLQMQQMRLLTEKKKLLRKYSL